MKIRTIITQDAEVDDQNSLRHFLFYANEVDLQGIVQTSSKFHWVGVPGAVKPEKKRGDDFGFEDSGPFDAPYRWPGTDWMFRVIDDYEKDYPNLIKHADGYPTPDYLRSITKIGNIGYEGEVEQKTEGSELIRERILDDDERTLYLQVWGGTNTIARALMDIYEEYGSTPEWPALKEKITKKVVITACGEQDPAYRDHVAELFPGIPFIKTLQMRSYAYPWFVMPEGDSKDTLKAEFMKKEILCGKSALADGYCTWLDGKRYEGEGEDAQFGANPDIIHTWFGAKMGLPPAQQYGFCQWCTTDAPSNSGWRKNEPVGIWTLNYKERKTVYKGFAQGLAGTQLGDGEPNSLQPLKSYIDRDAHPIFKFSGAIEAWDFNNNQKLRDTMALHFDEIVAGNSMKYSSCVNGNGALNFGTVKDFCEKAKAVGLTIYGHTLAWHSQQQPGYLNSLLKAKEVEVPDAEKVDVTDFTLTYDKIKSYNMWHDTSHKDYTVELVKE